VIHLEEWLDIKLLHKRKRPVLAALISSQWMCLGCSCPHQVLCGHIGAQACYSVGEVEANPRFQGSSSAMRFTG
jgi:hypothetical protein